MPSKTERNAFLMDSQKQNFPFSFQLWRATDLEKGSVEDSDFYKVTKNGPPISANSNRPSAGAKTGSRVFPFLSLGGKKCPSLFFFRENI